MTRRKGTAPKVSRKLRTRRPSILNDAQVGRVIESLQKRGIVPSSLSPGMDLILKGMLIQLAEELSTLGYLVIPPVETRGFLD